jgi:outer membrane protein TolC
VPLWFARPRGETRAARAHLAEASAQAQAMRNDVLRMVSMEHTETVTHLTLARRLEGAILPAAESAVTLSVRQYESGQGDVVRLLESLRVLLDAERNYFDELYHFGEHWSLLEQWVGQTLQKR